MGKKSILIHQVLDRDLTTATLGKDSPQLRAQHPRAEEVIHGEKCYDINILLLRSLESFVSGGLH